MHRNRFRFGFLVWSSLVIASGLPCPSFADELPLDQQLQTIRSMSEAQRKATMAANVAISDAEGAKFWPLYRAYRGEVLKLNDKTIVLMKDFAANFDSMTDAKAQALIDTLLSIEKERVALKTKYVAKYLNVLSPVKTLRVLQVENKLDAIIEEGFASVIPLVLPSK